MGSPLSTRLVTERLVLRPPRTSDMPALRRLLQRNIEHLRPWSPVAPQAIHPFSIVELTRSVMRQRRAWQSDRAYALLIEHRQNMGELLGRVVLSQVVRGAFENASIGYWIDTDQQNYGYTTEALGAVIRFAFQTLQLHRLQAAVLPSNASSRRVLEKLGFRQEGLAIRYLQIAGAWQDHVLYAITTEEDVPLAPSVARPSP